MRLRRFAGLLIPCFLLAGTAKAETVDAAADVKARAYAGAVLLTSGSPSDRAMAGFLKPSVTFTSEDDELRRRGWVDGVQLDDTIRGVEKASVVKQDTYWYCAIVDGGRIGCVPNK